MNQIKSALDQTRPFISLVAILFAFLAAWKGLTELLPVLGQVWAPRGDTQHLAVIAAALALASGSR